MQINSLKDLLRDFRVPEPTRHNPSLPNPVTTPVPERNKVVGNPVRESVNRQAALLISPIRCWLSQPLPPEKLPTPEHKEIERLKAELKKERNDHASTRDALGETNLRLREARQFIGQLEARLSELQTQCVEQEQIICQLEDLKL